MSILPSTLTTTGESHDLPQPTPANFAAWLQAHLNLELREGSAPIAYLRHAFFGDRDLRESASPVIEPPAQPRDCIVWANRGGGKTYLGAVATALDLLYKPGIEIRILAGSVEQAQKMHRYLRDLFELPAFSPALAKVTDRRLLLQNRSRVEVLARSQTSIRGTRVQKIRCDEVELFDQAMWEAAQLTTRSRRCGDWFVFGTIECLSTMHLPYGPMSRLITEAREGRRTLFRWGVLDVLAQCPANRPCQMEVVEQPPPPGVFSLPQLPAAGAVRISTRTIRTCPLFADCQGSAKQFKGGHLPIEDAIAQVTRVSRAVWESEMLCLRPQRSTCVYPEFSPDRHIISADPPLAGAAFYCGMDFGFRAPTAIVWASLDRSGALYILDERVAAGILVPDHIRALRAAPWPHPSWIGADPAGETQNDQTGQSAIQLLRAAGFEVLTRQSRVQTGIALIAARLRPADGSPPRLYIHRRCTHLLEAMEKYHYDPAKPESGEPVKDGNDHIMDALRYLVVNLETHAFRQSRYI